MDVQLNTSSIKNLASVAEAMKSDAAIANDAVPILSPENIRISRASADLESLLSKLLMETNEAKLNAARSRLASALDQLTDLNESEKKTIEEMRKLAEDQAQVEERLESKGRELNSATKELDSAEKSFDSAKADLAAAEKTQSAAEARYKAANKALDDYTNSGVPQDPAQIASLNADISAAKRSLDSATAKVDAAAGKVASAEKRLKEASDAYDSVKKAYDAIDGELSSLQTKFESLLDSLDASSLTALREAIRLDAGDIDHLHDEIEKDDKKHELSSIKTVEDVIADALDRLDGKMVDEVTDRHLDHI